ncbi:MAG TPA: kelch repeat-containing protein [Bacteroidia bacterium]|nr:kelch repeat-containing protein [Bacteroidia bacterium]
MKKNTLFFALFFLEVIAGKAQVINTITDNGIHNHIGDGGQSAKDISGNCNTWVQQANFLGVARYYAAGFTIGHYGFIGCGSDVSSNNYNDFYKWNQTTNTWSVITSYPGAGYEYSPVSFTIEGKGYVGLGWTGSGGANDLWRYDTATNAWTQMANLPGTGRYDEAVFVLGHKAYIIGGSAGGPPYLEDVWMYDAHTNTWKQMNNSPAGKTDDGPAFAIGNHGYYGGGKDGFASSYNLFWEYDTASDTWTSIASFPTVSTPSGLSRAFVIGSKGYVCTGTKTNSYTDDMSAGYAYDTNTKAWAYFTNMGANGIERGYSVAFSIDGCGYISTGEDSVGKMLKDLWGYCPCNDTLSNEAVAQITESAIDLKLYPNPSSGIIHISYTIPDGQETEFIVTDVYGRYLNSYKLNGQQTEITLNETLLDDGMYFYQLILSSKLISSGKFIITK